MTRGVWGSSRVHCKIQCATRLARRQSRVQVTSVASGVAHESCTGAAVVHDSGFAASTSSARATVRRTPNCFIAYFSKLEKRKQCVLHAISFSAVGGATNVFELSRADIFFTNNSSRKSRDDCDCGPRHATIQQFATRCGFGSLFDESRLLIATQ